MWSLLHLFWIHKRVLSLEIFHEYAHLGKGKSIHTAGQMEWFNCKFDDRSTVVGGTQRIGTPDGYAIPLSIESG